MNLTTVSHIKRYLITQTVPFRTSLDEFSFSRAIFRNFFVYISVDIPFCQSFTKYRGSCVIWLGSVFMEYPHRYMYCPAVFCHRHLTVSRRLTTPAHFTTFSLAVSRDAGKEKVYEPLTETLKHTIIQFSSKYRL